MLLNAYSERESQVLKISGLPLYPDETLLWGSDGDDGDDDGASPPLGTPFRRTVFFHWFLLLFRGFLQTS